jgi:hypothetical protein
MSEPSMESLGSPTGRDTDEYQWAEFNLPMDLVMAQPSESGAPSMGAAAVAEAD